ncbi:hypothetical protein B6U90_03550 [Thermoplasmatales archaeon ex4484_6]|nr:MAG: hypothetical protein B6U90_03550 [Thermoplasmatales archaeon ex4484_6]
MGFENGFDGMLLKVVLYILLAVSIVLFVQIIAYSTMSINNHRKRKNKQKWYPKWSRRLEDHLNGRDHIKPVEVGDDERKAFRDLLVFFYAGGEEDEIPAEIRGRSPLAESKKRRIRMLYRDMGFIEDDLEALRSGPWWKRTVALGRLSRLELNDAEDLALEMVTAKEAELAISAISYLASIQSRYLPEQIGSIYEWNESWMHKEITIELMRIRPGMKVIEELSGSPIAVVRKAAAMLSGRKGFHQSIRILRKLAEDKDTNVRVETSRSLGRIAVKRAYAVLEGMADDPSREVREAVAEALGNAPDSVGIEPLENLAYDEDPDVKVIARSTLSRKGWEGQAALLKLSESDPDMEMEFV